MRRNSIELEKQISGVLNDLRRISGDPERIRRLLALEKERRDVAQDKVVFIGMANVAKQDSGKSHRNEAEFFEAYLVDRITYAHRFGLADGAPDNLAELLVIGETLTYEQVKAAHSLPGSLTNERLSDERLLALRARYAGRLASLETYERGNLAQSIFAEEYPSFRWNFPWEGRVFVGHPDGITKDSVYEFKSTEKARYKAERARQATAQSDIYGLFFRRANRRVQVYCWEDGKLDSVDGRVDTDAAKAHLRKLCTRL
ncbi:MAG: hypothetical protein MOB07_07095 [Acidobacteria bacterium]|nr:hypothetical protein [Acidobacteriota bacterium]